MKTRIIVGLVVLAALSFMFQNCGQVNFARPTASGVLVAGATDPGVSPSGSTDGVQILPTVPNVPGSILPGNTEHTMGTTEVSTETEHVNSTPGTKTPPEEQHAEEDHGTSGGTQVSVESHSSAESHTSVESHGSVETHGNGEAEAHSGAESHAGADATAGSDDNTKKTPAAALQDNTTYVCILNGNGKSQRLALTDALVSKTGTPSDVCLSKSACLNIVSQIFEVKSAEQRGFCKSSSGNPHVIHMSDAQIAAMVTAQKK